ncbi:hypothetical protein [Hymenobacter koreensis]|uniref:Uncharacterized protein n=1 Tax=Hymenobacter koreensis TaxID=1084523 RepID=A0ABP8JBY1_9BACT
MNYDFYASKEDKLALLDYLFDSTDLLIYDLASEPGKEVCVYTNTDEVFRKFGALYGAIFSPTFQLWSPRFGAMPSFRRIELNPDRCEGQTFRFQTQGWGLIQLYFGRQFPQELEYTHIGHFSERSAKGHEGNELLSMGAVADWNWPEITSTARKLKHLLHAKWAVDKIGSTGVLPGAAACEREGVLLRLRR